MKRSQHIAENLETYHFFKGYYLRVFSRIFIKLYLCFNLLKYKISDTYIIYQKMKVL